MDIMDLYWVAGILEGEGCFMKGSPSRPRCPTLVLQMTDEDIIEKVSKFLEVVYFKQDRRKAHWKHSFIVRIRGKKAVRIMTLIYPIMGKRRRNQIQLAINSYKLHPFFKLDRRKVQEIKRKLKIGKETQSQIAKEYNVDRTTITYINTNKIWKNV